MNSRLDTIQASILKIKLKHLDKYSHARNFATDYYDKNFVGISGIVTPKRVSNSTHVFHQYTLKVEDGKRDDLKTYLQGQGVPSMVYYPLPLHAQIAFKTDRYKEGSFPVSEELCKSVLSLTIHTEMNTNMQDYIIQKIKNFFNLEN